jgi:hypothetical protein
VIGTVAVGRAPAERVDAGRDIAGGVIKPGGAVAVGVDQPGDLAMGVVGPGGALTQGIDEALAKAGRDIPDQRVNAPPRVDQTPQLPGGLLSESGEAAGGMGYVRAGAPAFP